MSATLDDWNCAERDERCPTAFGSVEDLDPPAVQATRACRVYGDNGSGGKVLADLVEQFDLDGPSAAGADHGPTGPAPRQLHRHPGAFAQIETRVPASVVRVFCRHSIAGLRHTDI